MTQENTMESWRNSLVVRLNAELPFGAATQQQRLAWLALHIREYVERWCGFVQHPSIASESKEFAFNSGLFLVIAVANELVESEITSDVPSPTQDQWRSFTRLYNQMRDAHDIGSRGRLLRLAEDFATGLGAR